MKTLNLNTDYQSSDQAFPEGKGHLSIIAIPAPNTKRTYEATPALERKLREANGAKELDCPPDFFTEPIDDERHSLELTPQGLCLEPVFSNPLIRIVVKLS